MEILRTIQDLHTAAARQPSGLGAALVPTMGALHAGHASLITHAAQVAQQKHLPAGCMVSIFINPAQFNDPADLDRYPRTLDADLTLCRDAGAAAVFIPSLQTIYPPPPAAPVLPPPLPQVALSPGLEDAHRPGHFEGVAQVVMRLFHLLQPAVAIFGEKDWQQLQLIRAIAAAASLPIEILSFPTIRDPSGLALSSRNRFLSPRERNAALAIPAALTTAAQTSNIQQAQQLMQQLLTIAGLKVDYAVIRDAESLGPVIHGRDARALIAAIAGKTRLIDNAPWHHG